MDAVDGATVLYGVPVSSLQSDVTVTDGVITGVLHYIEGGLAPSGPLSGSGHFLALEFDDTWNNYESVKVGLNPSMGSGLVDLLPDPDKNGVFKITNGNTQKFVIETQLKGSKVKTRTVYSLANLTYDPES